MVGIVDQVRSWSYRNDTELWSIYHMLKDNVRRYRVDLPDGAPYISARLSTGNLLVAAMLEIKRLRKETKQGTIKED